MGDYREKDRKSEVDIYIQADRETKNERGEEKGKRGTEREDDFIVC